MIHLGKRIFCYLDGVTPEERENKRIEKIQNLNLLNGETIPIFEEATQIAAHFIETPMAILGLILPDKLVIKAAVGLSHLGLMNEIATTRKIAREESFAIHVIDSQHFLIIEDTYSDSFFCQSILAQYYGIRAYLGMPLITRENICIGVLEVMDIQPREFNKKEVEFLNLTARWCLREYENLNILEQKISLKKEDKLAENLTEYYPSNQELKREEEIKEKVNEVLKIKIDLLKEISQDLKSPLTSIIGMSSVLGREIYGKLNKKQKEYISVISESGENLTDLIEEIISLDIFPDNSNYLKIGFVDLEMLKEQIINSLKNKVNQQKIQLEISIEPGQRNWNIDKEKIRKSLYYLLISIINIAEPNSNITLHFSEKNDYYYITIWNNHPWLGDNITNMNHQSFLINKILLVLFSEEKERKKEEKISNNMLSIKLSYEKLLNIWNQREEKNNSHSNQEMLTLLLSCHIIESHKGNLVIQGSEELGYRYILQIPKIITEN